MYPPEFLEKGFSFAFDFIQKTPSPVNDWEALIDEWKQDRSIAEREALKKQAVIDTLIFYFVDGSSFVKIFDKRDPQNIRIFVLNELERAVFLACVDVVSLQQLQQRFADIHEFKLSAILQSFEKNGLVFAEDEQYLCLPLRFSVSPLPELVTEYPMKAIA